MSCEEVRERLEAYVDDRLGPREREGVRRHIEVCPHCRSEAAAIHRLGDRLRDTFGSEPAPAGLWDRIESSLGTAESEHRTRSRRASGWQRYAAAAALLLAVLGAGFHGLGLYPSPGLQAQVVVSSVEELRAFVESGRPMDITSGDPAEVRDWFAGKLHFVPPAPAMAPGLELVGGRLCFFLDRRIAAYMYRADGHLLSLYVIPGLDLEPPEGEAVTIAGQRATVGEARGFASVFWRSGRLGYTLISELPEDRLIGAATALAGHS